ncbi:hypothetical protein HYY75_02090 [bacterium]|nr:hypothetical protein [bacterium]
MLKEIPTCRIFARIGKSQLHAKNFVFDGKVGIVGTYNMDYLSEEVNSEVMAVINSKPFSEELRETILSDVKESVEYRLGTAREPEFGPENIEAKNKWLIKICSKLGWLRPLF